MLAITPMPTFIDMSVICCKNQKPFFVEFARSHSKCFEQTSQMSINSSNSFYIMRPENAVSVT